MEDLVKAIDNFMKSIEARITELMSEAQEAENIYYKINLDNNQCLVVEIYNAETQKRAKDTLKMGEILSLASAGLIDDYLVSNIQKLIKQTK